MSDLVGRTLGSYKILDEIGHGGMANVYRAKQPSIGREVAVKVLPSHFLQDRTFVKRFTREVQVIAKLQHPHILPVYDFGEEDGLPYIVMALMTGGTLSDLIRREERLPLPEIVRLVEQIAGGLDHAHQKGIVHRDFKPSNVLLDENNNVYLADFGIAKAIEAVTQITGSGIVGTPAYMAPEATKTNKVTGLVDIYALGVTVFELLTGRHPYPAETPVGVLMAHATEPVPDVHTYRPDLPKEVQRVVDRAMAKDPATRYQTAGALAADLRAVMAGESPLTEAAPVPVGSGHISTIRMAPTRPAAAAPARRRLMMIIAAVVVIAALAGLTALGMPSMVSQMVSGQPLGGGETEEPVSETADRILEGHSDAVTSVALSPDGKTLASGSLDKTVILWDLETGDLIRTLETPEEVYDVEFYPDGTIVLVGGQQLYVTSWSAQTGEPIIDGFTSLPAGQLDVAISPTQSIYTFTSHDKAIPFFDASTNEWLKSWEYPAPVWALSYSSDATVIAAGMDNGTIIFRDASTEEEVRVLEGHTERINHLSFSPDGRMLASTSVDMTIILWDLETGEMLRTLSQHTDLVNDVSWAPDSNALASASLDGTIILWDLDTGEVLDTFEGGGNEIYSVVFNADGTVLASGMQDGTVALWNIE
ncbi:MAG: serine/threonine protein kinase [Anaerolineae bacterium]|nr:serine/threonine protein kinase [Anaerolineae bacterium]